MDYLWFYVLYLILPFSPLIFFGIIEIFINKEE